MAIRAVELVGSNGGGIGGEGTLFEVVKMRSGSSIVRSGSASWALRRGLLLKNSLSRYEMEFVLGKEVGKKAAWIKMSLMQYMNECRLTCRSFILTVNAPAEGILILLMSRVKRAKSSVKS